jgi:mevalonate pyrophosphate decarboxylase
VTNTFRDKDIDEIFITTDHKNTLLHISYLGATEETFYTRVDIVRLLDIIDGKEKGVMRK